MSTRSEKAQAASPWRWLLASLYHLALFVMRRLWRLLDWSIQKAEKFEEAHPEYERRDSLGDPRN